MTALARPDQKRPASAASNSADACRQLRNDPVDFAAPWIAVAVTGHRVSGDCPPAQRQPAPGIQESLQQLIAARAAHFMRFENDSPIRVDVHHGSQRLFRRLLNPCRALDEWGWFDECGFQAAAAWRISWASQASSTKSGVMVEGKKIIPGMTVAPVTLAAATTST